ncbi:hypothetical protein DL771_000185 [Monosporascus sp. 5C6A]|nr:hypothetical protein DL771_000185 [Monosporascus sp. 5C6A]
MADKKEKKRKRDEDGASRPNKKVAVQSSSSQSPKSNTIRVASIQTAKKCPPIIATSPGLCIPSSIQFDTYAKPQASTPKRNKKGSSSPSELLLHSSSHPKLDYTAKEDGPGGRESHLKHYIGVFDPKTGQLSVVEAKKMAVRGVVRALQPSEESAEERAMSKTMMQMRTDLGHAFGTKKAKKALASITENAIAPEKAIADAGGNANKLNASQQAVMESIREVTVGMASREDLQAAADAAKPVPPGNFDAKEIQDVYKPEELIGGDVLNAIPIKDWQDQIKKNLNKQHSSAFVAGRLVSIGQGPDAVTRLRTLRYLDLLIKFQRAAWAGKGRGAKRVPPKDKLREIMQPAPEPVIENIRRKFSANGEIRKFHVDLMHTYCCALAAILANYQFDTSALRYDMGLDEKQFAQYFREIGGRTQSVRRTEKGTQVQMASLSLPLEFPKVRFQLPKGRASLYANRYASCPTACIRNASRGESGRNSADWHPKLRSAMVMLSILHLYHRVFRTRTVGIAAPLVAPQSVLCMLAYVVVNLALVRPLSAYVEGNDTQRDEGRMNRLSVFGDVSSLALDFVVFFCRSRPSRACAWAAAAGSAPSPCSRLASPDIDYLVGCFLDSVEPAVGREAAAGQH